MKVFIRYSGGPCDKLETSRVTGSGETSGLVMNIKMCINSLQCTYKEKHAKYFIISFGDPCYFTVDLNEKW